MVNSFIFTGLILLAGLAGGLIGSACGKRRNAPDVEGRIAELEERLDTLADHAMEEAKRLRTGVSDVDIRADELHDHYLDLKRILAEQNDRLNECELLIGDTPTGGLLGRVSALEDAQKTHEQDAVIVNGWTEEIEALKKELEGLQMVNDAEHQALRNVLLGGKEGARG